MAPTREIGLIGYGCTDYVKKADRPLLTFLAQAGQKAIASAGLKKADIDGLAICSFELPPDNAVTVAEQFGLSPSWAYLGTAGGAGPVASVLNAVRAIEAGHATNVLCIAGDAYDVSGLFRLLDNFGQALLPATVRRTASAAQTDCSASSSASTWRPMARHAHSLGALPSISDETRSKMKQHCCADP